MHKIKIKNSIVIFVILSLLIGPIANFTSILTHGQSKPVNALAPAEVNLVKALSEHTNPQVGVPVHRSPPPIRMPAEPNIPLVPSAPVGYLDATSGVTFTGQFSYAVPVEVPEGRANLAPELSFRYASRSGNGLLGVGWSLTGMSQITHCPKTIATEGDVDGVDFDGTDRFCLDGEKLVSFAGVYGSHYAEYRTERDPFARIVSYGSNGPSSFRVWSKDGRIMTYRGIVAHRIKQDDTSLSIVPDGDVIPIWVLDEVRDRSGNYMRYKYHTSASTAAPFGFEVYPLAIEYTLSDKSKNDPPLRRVDFSYEKRPDPYFEYQGGIRFETTKRLIEIRTTAPTSQLNGVARTAWSYQVQYEPLSVCIDNCPATPPPSWRSRITAISKCDGAKPAVCGWKRQFVWSKQMPSFTSHAAPSSPKDGKAKAVLVLDLNGDSKDDILYQVPAVQHLRHTYARFGGTEGLGPAVLVKLAGSTFSVLELVLTASRALDVDGDGTTEIYATFRDLKGHLRYAVLHWNTAQSLFVVSGPVIDGPTSKDVVDSVRIIDLDGDSRPDVLRRAGPYLNWVYQENNDAQLSADIPTGVASNCFERTRAVDLDGDGRGQILGFHLDQGDTDCTASRGIGIDDNYIFSQSTRWKLADLPTNNSSPGVVLIDANGDGLKDVVYPGGASPHPKVAWNTGNGFALNEPLAIGPHDETYVYGPLSNGKYVDLFYKDGGNRVADVNGDGLEDIISFRGYWGVLDGKRPSIQLHLSGRMPSGEWGFTTHTLPQQGGLRHGSDDYPQTGIGWPTSQVGDFNGDGLVDIVQITPYPFDPNHFEVLLQELAVGDAITEVWDEFALHARETITYSTEWSAASTIGSMYIACAYPQVCVERGMPVVRTHYTSQGETVGAYRRTEYDYANPRIDVQGRGFLGFGMMRERDPDLPREVITTFDHVTRVGTIYPYAGLPATQTVIEPIIEQPANLPTQPPPGQKAIARVTKRTTQYALKSPPKSKSYFVIPSRWTALEWEEQVQMKPDGIVLLQSPKVTVLRRRTGSNSYDDYGNLLSSIVSTEGGVRRSMVATYTNDTSQWLIGLRETHDVWVTNSLQMSPASPRRTEFDYESATGLLTQVRSEPLQPSVSRTTTFYRDKRGLVYETSDAVANEPVRWTYFAHDAEGVFITQRYNDLLLYEVGYTDPAFGVPTLVQQPDGTQTEYQYDGFGRLAGVNPVQAGEGLVVYYSGDDRAVAGHPRGVAVTTSHDGGGGTVLYHDELGRPWERATKGFDGLPANWIHQTVAFNVFGSVIRRYRPGVGAHGASATVEVMDTLGRTVLVREPNKAETVFVQSMFQTKATDPQGRVKFLRRDKDDRVIQSAEVNKGVELKTNFKYEMFDQLETAIGPDKAVTTIDYDAAGRRKSLDDPNRGFSQFVYNGFGELKSVTEPSNQTATYTRDLLGRVTSRTDIDGVTQVVWDQGDYAKGKLSSTLSPYGVTTDYVYNTDRLLESATWGIGGVKYQFARKYDSLGRVSRLLYPDVSNRPRFTVEQHYNIAGYLASAWDVSVQKELLYEVTSRSLDFLLGDRQLGTTLKTTRQYDPATGRLAKIQATGGSGGYNLAYTYYPDGNVATRTDHSTTTTRTERFSYDDLNRLEQWRLAYGSTIRTTKYGYDDGGNLESVQVDNGPVAVNTFVQGKPHLLHSDGAGTYTYDTRGRQLTTPVRTVTYTGFDLPRTVTTTSGTTTIDYDAFGDRVRKAGPTEEVISLSDLYERRKGNETEHVFYVQSEEGPVAQVVWNETKATENTLFVETDMLGTVGFVSNATAGTVARLYYDPFGRRIKAAGDPDTPPLDVKLGFTGQRHDDELGLIDMKGRVYDPAQRRFLTADPFVTDPLSGQSHNRYAYALNNPVRYFDPTGFSNEETTQVGEGEGDVPPTTGTEPASVQNDPKQKKNAPSTNGSDAEGNEPQQPVDATVYAGAPPPDDDPPLKNGGGMTAPEIDSPKPDPGPHPDDTFLRSIGVGLLGLLPSLPIIPKSETAGDLAWRAFSSIPAVGTFMGGFGLARNFARAIASPDLNDAADGAGSAVAGMVGLLAAAVGVRGAVAAAGSPNIKPGSAGGSTAGKPFPPSIKEAARAENPGGICVFCRRAGPTQVDHAIARARGGNATLDNAQLACPHCNPSKGARDFPVNPPPGYSGPWPPPHWGIP